MAVRYPRGTDGEYIHSDWSAEASVTSEGALTCHRVGKDVTLITYGTLINNVLSAAEILSEQWIEATVLRLQTVSPLPVQQILSQMSQSQHVVIVEEICNGSGVRQELSYLLRNKAPACRVDGIDLGRSFAVQGDMQALYKFYGMDAASIAEFTREVLSHES